MTLGGAGDIWVVRTQTRGQEAVTTGDRDTQVGALASGADMVMDPGLGQRVIGGQVVKVGGLGDQLPIPPELVWPGDGNGVTPVQPVLKHRDTLDVAELTKVEVMLLVVEKAIS